MKTNYNFDKYDSEFEKSQKYATLIKKNQSMLLQFSLYCCILARFLKNEFFLHPTITPSKATSDHLRNSELGFQTLKSNGEIDFNKLKRVYT